MSRGAPTSWKVIILIVCGLTMHGCKTQSRNHRGPGPDLKRFDFESVHMGTKFSISLYGTNREVALQAATDAFQRVEELEQIFSDYRADSELNLLRGKPIHQPVRVSEDLFVILKQSRHLAEISGGAFDPTIGPYVRLWRFARKRHALPSTEEMISARKAVGWRNLILQEDRAVTQTATNMQLDLGGIAKGYAADAALRLLASRGYPSSMVAAGGDIAVGEPPPGRKGWRVGIAPMKKRSGAKKYISLRNAGISTSGDTEQFMEINGQKYSHVISPKTGLGLTNGIQATVVAPNATLSDGLATAVCVLGEQKGKDLIESLRGCSVYVISEAGAGGFAETWSTGFRAHLEQLPGAKPD